MEEPQQEQQDNFEEAARRVSERRQSVRLLHEGELMKEIQKANASSKARRERRRRCSCCLDCERLVERFIYWWRHPFMRLLAPLYIMMSDLIVHAADPNDHAEVEYAMPYAGEAWNLLNPFNGQPLPWPMLVVKAMAAFLAIHIGLHIPAACHFLARQFRCSGRNNIFRGDRAASMGPLVAALMCLVGMAQLWNSCLGMMHVFRPPATQYDQEYTEYLSQGTGISYRTSANALDTLVFVLDFTAIFLVIDVVLQDGSQYPEVTKVQLVGDRTLDMRKVWTQKWDGRFRIIVTWAVSSTMTSLAMIFTWRRSRDWMILREDETGLWAHISWIFDLDCFDRAVLYASQFVFDVMIVLQDWEFPTFDNQLKIAILGTNLAFEGRFANYFMMVAVACVDLKCLVATINYEPLYVAQYADEDNYVWAITNQTLIKQARRGTTFPTFANRTAEGCFRPLTKAELAQTGCHDEFLARGGNESYIHPRGFALAGGFNACCDVRIRARWTPEAFGGEHARRNKAILVVPVVLVLLNSRILARIIARSRKEMCRRVVLCQRMFEQLVMDARMRDRAGTDGWRVHHSFVEMRWKVLEASVPEAPAEYADGQEFDEDEEAAFTSDEDEMEQEYSGQYHIRLQRPPVRGCPLLLVSSTGVFSIEAGLSATIQDLIDQLHKEGFIIEGIGPHHLRLRIRPYGSLNPTHYIGTLLPKSKEEDAVCIFVHGRLKIRTSVMQQEAVTWPQALARGFSRGVGACVGRVCWGCGMVVGCRSTCKDRCSECCSCCGLSEACDLLSRGGQHPPPPLRWPSQRPMGFQTRGRHSAASSRSRRSARQKARSGTSIQQVELTGSAISSLGRSQALLSQASMSSMPAFPEQRTMEASAP